MAGNHTGNRFRALCAREGIHCWVRAFVDAGFPGELAEARRLADELARDFGGAEVLINATGGTKTMAFALIAGLRGVTTGPAYYCDTGNGMIDWITLAGSRKSLPIQTVLGTENYLAAQGFVIVGVPATDTPARRRMRDDRRSITEALVHLFVTNGRASATFAKWCRDANQQGTFGAPRPRHRDLQPLFEELVSFGLLETASAGLRHTGAAVGYLARHQWLEEYCETAAIDAGLHDTLCGVRLQYSEGGRIDRLPASARSDYEFDLAATWRNRLLFVECKAKGADPAEVRQAYPGGSQAAGPFGKKLFVSTGPASAEIRARADRLAIEVISGPDVLGLRHRIARWMNEEPRAPSKAGQRVATAANDR
jgi:hypothetical protein